MFGSLDPAKLLIILVLGFVVLGPERLPKVARQLGGAWRELSRMRDQVTEEVRSALPDLDLPHIPRSPAGAVSGFLRDLTSTPSANVEVEADGHGEANDATIVPSASLSHSASTERSEASSGGVEALDNAGRTVRSAAVTRSSRGLDPDDAAMN